MDRGETLDKRNIEEIIALTPVQEGMLFHYLKDPAGDPYVEQLCVVLSGRVDRRRAEAAWNRVVQANGTLRTLFRWENVKRPIQMVLKVHRLDFRYYELNGSEFQNIKDRDRQEGFDLRRVPFRVSLCRTGKKRFVLIVSHHHILFDGWSSAIILKEFWQAYRMNDDCRDAPVPHKPSFREYVRYVQDQDQTMQAAFWMKYLKGFEFSEGPSAERINRGRKNRSGYRLTFAPGTAGQLESFVRTRKLTGAAVLYTAWGILLQQINSQQDVIFAATVSGRNGRLEGVEDMVGLLINTLPLRIHCPAEDRLLEVLEGVNRHLREREAVETTSPAVVNEYLERATGQLLFDSVVVLENYPLELKPGEPAKGVAVEDYSIVEQTGHDLTVIITQFDRLEISLTYDERLFEEEMIEVLCRRYEGIVAAILSDPRRRVAETEWILSKDRGWLIDTLSRRRRNRVSAGAVSYTAPRDELERKLVNIWAVVLRREQSQIGIDDNFFDFGGHSLKASMLAARLHSLLEVKVPLIEIFRHSTIRRLASYILRADRDRYRVILPAEAREYYAASSAQKRLYMIQQMDTGGIAYNGPLVMVVTGDLDTERLEDSLVQLVRRHECLRTSFVEIDGEPVQKIHSHVKAGIEILESGGEGLRELDLLTGGRESESGRRPYHGLDTLTRNFIKPFDLRRAPLLRLGLLRVKRAVFVMLVDIHHIISDGISRDVLMKEMAALYSGRSLAPVSVRYRDFCHWQSCRLDSGELDSQAAYWQAIYEAKPPEIILPHDFPRPPVMQYKGARIRSSLEPEKAAELRNLAAETDVTLFMVLLAVMNIVLAKYGDQEDIVVGTAVGGRFHADIEDAVGLFMETMALRNGPWGGFTFGEFLRRVRESTLQAYGHQEYPYRELLRNVGGEFASGRQRLFDVMLIVQNQERTELRLPGTKVLPYWYDPGIAKLDLTLEAYEIPDTIAFEWEYDTSLFRAATIERFEAHFFHILEQVLADGEVKLSEFELITEAEKRQVLEDLNGTRSTYDGEKTVPVLWTDQTAKSPARLAAVGRGSGSLDKDSLMQLTYRQLDREAAKIARSLRGQGVRFDTIVAIQSERSVEMLAGLLGIMACGGAYLPVDPALPPERLQYMLADSGSRLLLTEGRIDNICPEEDDLPPGENGLEGICPAALAYVIYTSGSTGRPKGVLVDHGNLAGYVHSFWQEFDIAPLDVVVQQASFSFDTFGEEIYPVLLRGGRVAIPENSQVRDVVLLAEFIARHGCTVLDCSPLLLNELNRLAGPALRSLRIVISGGDVLKGEYIDQLLEIGCVYNTYGPTEATICSAYHRCTAADDADVPIGRPIANYRVSILDRHGAVCPEAVAGELYIAGVGLSRGYLNRPELTAEKYADYSYRTGDRVRWTAEGNIEFLGRIDEQVKIRGFRIELGEIEHCLLRHESITEAAVIARSDGRRDKYLVAYIVTGAAGPYDRTDPAPWREYLSGKLPPYMIPAYFLELAALPLTVSGKVDRSALPAPADTDWFSASEYRPPGSELERRMATVWQEILGIRQVGIDDDFFELGGDSILANRVIARMRDEIDRDISLRRFFENPSIAALSRTVHQGLEGVEHIPRVKRQGRIPLSFSQERLWFLQQLDGDSTAYHVPRALRIRGRVDVTLFERAFTEIIRRHEILRTVFPSVEGVPVQEIGPPFEFTIPVMDWRDLPREEREKRAREFIVAEGRRSFDFDRGPLIRVTLLRLGDEESILVSAEHHLVHDGWTQGVMLREFVRIYRALAAGEPPSQPELPIQYADYAVWQRDYMSGERLERHLNFWKKELADLPPLLELPADFPRPSIISGAGRMERLVLPRRLAVQLERFSQRKGATLFMTMIAVFKVLLHRYSGIEDLCVGTGIANRRCREMEGMLGMVINTIPLRTQLAGDMRFTEYLDRVKATCLRAYEFEETPFEKIVELLSPERSLSYSPLVQVLYSFMDTPTEGLSLPDLEFSVEHSHNLSAKFDMTIVVIPPRQGEELGGEILIDWEYRSDLFSEATMNSMMSQYQRLLNRIIEHDNEEIAALPMLGEAELKKILRVWNDTRTPFPEEQTIHRFFEEQADRLPDAVALALDYSSLSYAALKERAGELAGELLTHGVEPGELVALMVERSPDMMAGVLGILQAGGAYLPIDHDYPRQRIYYVMNDSRTRVLVTHRDLWEKVETLKSWTGESVFLGGEAASRRSSGLPTRQPSNSSGIAYCIYTSGTTGHPKGVAVTHRSLMNLLLVLGDAYPFGPTDAYLLKTSFLFDVSMTELFGWIMGGGRLALLEPGGEKDPGAILESVERHQVSHINFVPSMFTIFTAMLTPGNREQLSSLKYIFLAGEALSPELVDQFEQKRGDLPVRLENLYGPTEATVYASGYSLSHWTGQGSVPIGRPLANMTLYVLDKHFRLQPPGIPGELCIGGAGLASGYLNNPDLTSERFVEQPTLPLFRHTAAVEVPGSRDCGHTGSRLLYRTGDLARWLPDGNIDFLGRIDHQVKIRGFRIELPEIEIQLKKYPRLKEAVVVDREKDDGEKYLCAYVVTSSSDNTNDSGLAGDLRSHLSLSLPGYMIPAYFIPIDGIPLTLSGKLDRKRLPLPAIAATGEHIAPSGQVEEKLAAIWADILGIEKKTIGVHRNFFELGGHSLKATVMAAKIHRELDVKLSLTQIFRTPRIRGLAEYIKKVQPDAYEGILPLEKREYYPQSSAQNRLYLLQEMAVEGIVYNIPAVFAAAGPLDRERLRETFRWILDRHESFRTSFRMINGRPVQQVWSPEDIEFDIEYFDRVPEAGNGISQSDDDIVNRFIRPFDLSRPPLLRAGLIEAGHPSREGKYVLMVDMHHIVADGSSLDLLIADFMNLYRGQEIDPLKIQYKDYSRWQQQESQQDYLRQQRVFWLDQLQGELPVLNLPCDHPRPPVQSFAGNRLSFEVDPDTTTALKSLAAIQEVTLFMLLLSAYSLLLSKLSGQEDIAVGVPVAARRHADLAPIIGMFVNTLVMRTFPHGDLSFAGFLREVRERTLAAFDNQEYPFEDLLEDLSGNISRDISRNPLFDTMFALQNMDIRQVMIPGLALKPQEFEGRQARFDLFMQVFDAADRLVLKLEYCTDLFDRDTIERFISYFITSLGEVAADPAKRLFEVQMLTTEEKQRMLQDFNGSAAEYPHGQMIHLLLAEQALRYPDRTALAGWQHVTYRELDSRAQFLARQLSAEGAGFGIVGLMADRCPEMVIGIFAILKAGSAFLPINPDYPRQRVKFMLTESGAAMVLTDRRDRPISLSLGYLPVTVGVDRGRRLHPLPTPAVHLNPHNPLAYIIYTSGSTGRPKGVAVTHGSLMNLLQALEGAYPLGVYDTYLLKTSFLFDVSMTELFGWIMGGGRLVLLEPGGEKDPAAILETVERHQVSHINFVPSMFTIFTAMLSPVNRGQLSSLKYIFLAGEALSPELVNRFEQKRGDLPVRLENLYGPTEATVYASGYSLSHWTGRGSVPIGRPLTNVGLYILDKHSRLQPPGVPGELCIGGTGLAPGYLNKPDLTAERFVENRDIPLFRPDAARTPSESRYSNIYESRLLYRTGDLARWLWDGNIEFLGRIDHQVKIRGFRIELPEIEIQLKRHPRINEAVVIDREFEEGDRYLCAFVVTGSAVPEKTEEAGSELRVKQDIERPLRIYLSERLPDYMIPSYFVQLETMPLTAGGKIDLKTLAELDIGRTCTNYVAPRDEIEEKIVYLWSELLGAESGIIGIRDNFFQAGGNSLKAATLVFRIYKEFRVDVELDKIFLYPTIEQLAQKVRASGKIYSSGILPVEKREYYDLSFAQRRLWILCQFKEGNTAYNMPGASVLTGELDVEAFRLAVGRLADRHESLRTVFINIQGEPRQKIITDVEFEPELIDLSRLNEQAGNQEAERLFFENAYRAFDLEKGPLFRFTILKLSATKYVLIYNFHHIINDAWSLGNISNELAKLYKTFSGKEPDPLDHQKLQYRDYTYWHNRIISHRGLIDSKRYLLEKFKDKPNGIELPLDRPRSPVQTFNGGHVSFSLSEEKRIELHYFCLEREVTLFMGLLSLLNVFLFKYTGQRDIIVGSPIAGRRRSELFPMIGFLVNTLVYRTQVNPEETFRDLMLKVKEETLSCYTHQDYPFDLLVEQLGLARDLTGSPLFNLMLAYNNIDMDSGLLVLPGVKVSNFEYAEDLNMSKFDLIFFMNERRGRIHITIEYNSDLFFRTTVERWAANFQVLVSDVLDRRGVPIHSLNILTEAELRRLTSEFNGSDTSIPLLTFPEMFQNQVEKRPEKTAVVGPPRKDEAISPGAGRWGTMAVDDMAPTVTYRDLNTRVNKLARYLREECRARPNDVVGIAMTRCVDMIAALLAVIKSGAGYLAVDPSYPKKRISYTLRDTQVDLMIVDETGRALFGDYKTDFIDIRYTGEAIASKAAENLSPVNRPSDILYVTYTSGSTGTPNGAAVSHATLLNLIQWQHTYTSIDSSLSCLQFASINFDVSFQEIMATLTGGGALHLIGEDERKDIDYLLDFISGRGIEILYLPFYYLNFLFSEATGWQEPAFSHPLKHIVTAGEQLIVTPGLKTFLDSNPGIRLHNHYGPCELHVVTSYTMDSSTAVAGSLPPIGKPIANNRILILDPYRLPVPVGVWGDLYLVGPAGFTGYINNPELTEEKSLSLPQMQLDGKRLYSTGDIGRFLEDGNIEFKGRRDSQVKIRGFRVEPGEVESKILSIDRVKECVVVVREGENNQKILVAYLVSESIENAEINRILHAELPLYMIPRLVQLDRIPLLPNGKVDRDKLPEPEFDSEEFYTPPRDELEEQLVAVWSEVLGIDRGMIGIDSNFFELGGHSLTATIMVSRIHKKLSKHVPLPEIFNIPTIRELGKYVKELEDDEFTAVRPVEKRDFYLLSSAQKRLFILQQMEDDPTAYNMPIVRRLEGVIDRDRIRQTLMQMIKRHESLRTSFEVREGEPVQRVHRAEDIEFEIEYHESALKEPAAVNNRDSDPGSPCGLSANREMVSRFIRPFDLTRPPLLRMVLIRLEETEHVLLLDTHHIISDGTSLDIFIGEFVATYHGRELSPLPVQYKDFSEMQNSEKKRDKISKQAEYWLRQFDGDIPLLHLPTDYERPGMKSFAGESVAIEIGPGLTGGLKKLVLKEDVTLFMLLLAVFYVLLSKLTGAEDIVIGTGVRGRRHSDLEPIIGMFVNMLALRNKPLREMRFRDFLRSVKENTLIAFENQDFQFEELVEMLVDNRAPDRHPLFDVAFTIQEKVKHKIDMPDLNLGPFPYENPTAKFDLTLFVYDEGENMQAVIEYKVKLFRRDTIEIFARDFKKMLSAVVDDVEVRLEDIKISHGLESSKSELPGMDFGF